MGQSGLESLTRILSERWALPESGETLIERLLKRIRYLLENDARALVSAMYRLDISERRVAGAMENKDREHGARILAKAVIDRELQRMESRNQSSRSQLPGNP